MNIRLVVGRSKQKRQLHRLNFARSIEGKPLPVTSQEARVIVAFDEDGMSFMPELSVAVRLKPSEINRVIDNLVERNYIKREDSHLMQLTPSGKNLRKKLRSDSLRLARRVSFENDY